MTKEMIKKDVTIWSYEKTIRQDQQDFRYLAQAPEDPEQPRKAICFVFTGQPGLCLKCENKF